MVAVEPIEPTTLQVLAWVRVHRFASGQVKRLCRTGLDPMYGRRRRTCSDESTPGGSYIDPTSVVALECYVSSCNMIKAAGQCRVSSIECILSTRRTCLL